jgi:predicted nucleotidyltransferase
MHGSIAQRRDDIVALCRRLGVRSLAVFGSATGPDFDESTSDADFVVEFVGGEGFDYVDAYFTLKEELERLLGRPVDLIASASIRNPYFLESVEQTKETLYAA